MADIRSMFWRLPPSRLTRSQPHNLRMARERIDALRIRRLLGQSGEMSRAALQAKLGLGQPIVSRWLRRMLKEGEIELTAEKRKVAWGQVPAASTRTKLTRKAAGTVPFRGPLARSRAPIVKSFSRSSDGAPLAQAFACSPSLRGIPRGSARAPHAAHPLAQAFACSPSLRGIPRGNARAPHAAHPLAQASPAHRRSGASPSGPRARSAV